MVGGFQKPSTNYVEGIFLNNDKIRSCVVCNSKYSFCPRCEKDMHKPLYHFTFCSEKCKDIYDITSKYTDKRIDKENAKQRLSTLEPIEVSKLADCYKKCVDEINAVELVNTVEVIDVKTDDVSVVEENVEVNTVVVDKTTVEETVVEEETVKPKRRTKKAKATE